MRIPQLLTRHDHYSRGEGALIYLIGVITGGILSYPRLPRTKQVQRNVYTVTIPSHAHCYSGVGGDLVTWEQGKSGSPKVFVHNAGSEFWVQLQPTLVHRAGWFVFLHPIAGMSAPLDHIGNDVHYGERLYHRDFANKPATIRVCNF